MKTPYDAALRVRQRELDEVGAAIRNGAGSVAMLEREREQMSAAMHNEARLVAEGLMEGDLALVSPAWQGRMQSERRALGARQAEVQARLDHLRDAAVDAYGVLRGIETAADTYRTEATRALAAAEQSTGDDLSTAAFLKSLRAARRDGRR